MRNADAIFAKGWSLELEPVVNVDALKMKLLETEGSSITKLQEYVAGVYDLFREIKLFELKPNVKNVQLTPDSFFEITRAGISFEERHMYSQEYHGKLAVAVATNHHGVRHRLPEAKKEAQIGHWRGWWCSGGRSAAGGGSSPLAFIEPLWDGGLGSSRRCVTGGGGLVDSFAPGLVRLLQICSDISGGGCQDEVRSF
ncbi:hypothetical protein RHGRI_025577 [Rhododendron griersonianum]|uniref:Uncharacterized protein n=1 Tax=Rhododendron griersonianum TaxID=479676 RepID=A0AAV6IT45_9ERIC|nr:hypothetical protein RHGRI_025577 [Rhododendron griersonianum]